MTFESIILFSTRRGAFRAEDCLDWFRNLVRTCNNKGIEHPTFIIDNAPAHCRLESIAEEFPHVKLLRLAPYSNLLNPIELMWSAFKSHLKRMLHERMQGLLDNIQNDGLSERERRMQEMEQIAQEAIQLITPEVLVCFYNRVERYYPDVSRQDDLRELP